MIKLFLEDVREPYNNSWIFVRKLLRSYRVIKIRTCGSSFYRS